MGEADRKLALVKKRCESDLKFLCTQMLGMSVWEDSVHSDLAKELDAPDNKKLILVPRGHFKSTIGTVSWSIQQMLRDPNVRILITNAVWNRSKEFLQQITEYLLDKSELSLFYGQFNGPGSRFTQEEITIAQKVDPTRRGPSVRTAGLESSLTGSHPDIIIHDDLVEENNIGTKEQIQKVIRFYQNSLDLLAPGGKVVVIGTRWSESDLYGHLIEHEMTSLNGKPVQPNERTKWRELLQQTIKAR